MKRRPFGRKIFSPNGLWCTRCVGERDDAGMSAVSGASPDAAPSGAVRAVELAIRGAVYDEFMCQLLGATVKGAVRGAVPAFKDD